jgi:orotate phosphoribosyltransferase
VTTIAEDVLELLRHTGALLEGHFLLTSGLHSARYIQCAKVLQYPQHAETLGKWIAARWHERDIDVVISPALGGIVIGQEVARALGARGLFGEREQGRMTLRRGFELTPGERVLVVEDVVTTGGSVQEIIRLVHECQATAVGVGVILDRSDGQAHFVVPFQPLATLPVPNYAATLCPLCQQGSEPIKPGSRQR